MVEFRNASSPLPPATVVVDAPVGAVYAVRTHEDLKYVHGITEPGSLQPIGQFLLNRGALTQEELNEALAMQRGMARRRLGWILMTLGHFDDVALGRLLAAHHGVPCVTLASYQAARDFRDLLPTNAAQGGSMAILHDEPENAWLAVADVTDIRAVEDVAKALGKRVVTVMASHHEIAEFFLNDRRNSSAAFDPDYAGEERRGTSTET